VLADEGRGSLAFGHTYISAEPTPQLLESAITPNWYSDAHNRYVLAVHGLMLSGPRDTEVIR
jgi:hypothetical protein